VPARSRRFLTRALLAAVLGFTAAFAVACGSSGSGKGLLSAGESRTISSALDAVSSAVRAHSCTRAKSAVTALDASLQNLSPNTSSQLVRNLGHGATTVSQLALSQCHPHPKPTTTSTTATTTTSTTVVTTTTQTSTTPSVPSTPSVPTTSSTPETTPATTQSTPAPGNGSGNGNGNGNGSGGGGGAGLTGQGSQ
jgi:hypothetical protein